MELTPVNYDLLEQLHPDVHPDSVQGLCDRLSQIYVGNTDGQALAKEMFERALSRIRPRNEVRGVYVLSGKRSTAKKTLVNSVTQVLFGAADRRIMINCKELINPFTVLRLLDSSILNAGMPQMPGMPGMGKGPGVPLLSQESLKKVRGTSSVDCTIVCLNHFQAAPELLIQTLHRIFSDGIYSLDDGTKNKIDFRDVIWILLLDTDDASGVTGLSAGENSGRGAIKSLLGDELMERVDGIAVCRPFNRDEQKRILGMEIDVFAQDVKARVGCDIVVDEPGREFLLDKMLESSPQGLVRGSDLIANLVRHVIRPINVEELKGNVKKGRTVFVTCRGDNRLSFHVADLPSVQEGSDGPALSGFTDDQGSLPSAAIESSTTGDGTDDNQPRVRNRFSISQTFEDEGEARGWLDKIDELLVALPAIDHAENVKKTLKNFQGKWMLRVEFVTSGQGFAAVTGELPDWGQGSFLMYKTA